MVVEGIGGFLCPVSETSTLGDLAVFLDLPLLIVTRRNLGTLNHTILTVEAATKRGLRIAGVIVNSPDPETGDVAEATNVEEIARWLPEGVPLLGAVGYQRGDSATAEILPRVAWPWRDRVAASRLVEVV